MGKKSIWEILFMMKLCQRTCCLLSKVAYLIYFRLTNHFKIHNGRIQCKSGFGTWIRCSRAFEIFYVIKPPSGSSKMLRTCSKDGELSKFGTSRTIDELYCDWKKERKIIWYYLLFLCTLGWIFLLDKNPEFSTLYLIFFQTNLSISYY